MVVYLLSVGGSSLVTTVTTFFFEPEPFDSSSLLVSCSLFDATEVDDLMFR